MISSTVIISTIIFVISLISITLSVPIEQQLRHNQQQQQQQLKQQNFNQQYLNNHDFSNDRYFMKMKKWVDSQNQLPSYGFDNSWNRMHYFPGEKRMDDKFIVDDYPNLSPGRLEWNFNRL